MEYFYDILHALLVIANFIVVPALAYGSQLALGAVGITLIFAVLKFSNFAHGETMAFGAISTILFTWLFQHLGWASSVLPTALFALPFALLTTILLVLATDKWVYNYHRKISSNPLILMIVSIGVMFMLNGLNRVILGTGDIVFADGVRFILRAGEFKKSTGLDEGLTIKTTQLITIFITFSTIIALHFFLFKSRLGKAMRAFSDNENLALLSGIEPRKIIRLTWVISAIMATLAGGLYGLDKGYQPYTFFHLLLPLFAAAIVGGLGNPLGAIMGGYLIAFSEIGLTFAFRKVWNYLGPEQFATDGLLQMIATEYKLAISFVILVIVLLFRPTGIFKSRVE